VTAALLLAIAAAVAEPAGGPESCVLPVLLLAPAATEASATAAVNALVLLSLLTAGVISLLQVAEAADSTAVPTVESCCAAVAFSV
jgi:hypothetical protein